MNERRGPFIMGGSSLLVIFAVLCLTVFALLGLSTVQANARLAEASRESAAAYYAADAQAEELLSRIRSGERPEGVSVDGDAYSYTCPISDTQCLEVEVRVKGADYTVVRWQAASTADWHTDQTLELWDGDPIADLGQS